MSEDEQRQIKAMVLLEAEEAKSALALLRAKADQWIRFHDLVSTMLSHSKRELATRIVDPECRTERTVLESAAPSFGEAMNIRAVLSLDHDLESAFMRAEQAQARKKELGFHS